MTAINLLIGGEAGQGLVTIGQLLSKTLIKTGYDILVSQSYHSRIRGGHNTFAVRIGTEKLWAPVDAVDILVALNEETIDLHRGQLTDGGILVTDRKFKGDDGTRLSVPFEELGKRRLYNTVAMGTVGAILGLSEDMLGKTLENLIGKKHPEVLDENLEALTKSYDWGKANKPDTFKGLPQPEAGAPRMMLNGNEAIGLGALAAGLKFVSFYPMTPSTSIALTVIAHADSMGCVAEQAEDEIAAINMALGASYAGAPSMACTSGGGFALMNEGISLAGMTETPVVVAIAQRPGPATGLPTRTEQGDLELVLHAGHGEFPRAIFAPGSVESCFHLTQQAFVQAERYQTPTFILTDQFLADSYRAVVPFDLSEVKTVQPSRSYSEADIEKPYQRYAPTDSGISPRLLPGTTENLVVVDSDEHYASGHITEEQPVRDTMVEKRLRKLKGMVSEVIPPEFKGDEAPELLMVSWGSSQGPVEEAAMRLREQGKSVGTLHFSQVWPLVPNQFLDILKAARKVVGVEANATGQFARLLRREAGFAISDLVLRYDGLPFTPSYILNKLTSDTAR